MGGWVGGCQDAKSCHFVAPSFKLELARFSVKLSIQDGAECGKKAKDLYVKCGGQELLTQPQPVLSSQIECS